MIDMKKLFIVSLTLVLSFLFFNTDADAQRKRLSAPEFVLGLGVGAFAASNDAYGQVGTQTTYGMRLGRGLTGYAKWAFDKYRSHRLTFSMTYQKMVNDNSGGNYFTNIFKFSPKEPYTDFNIYTGALGYEYTFGAPCCNKQSIGAGITFNLINAGSGNKPASIDNAFRIGFQITSEYEFLLDDKGRYGINLGFKAGLLNVFLLDNGGDHNLNDGEGVRPFATDQNNRWIGIGGLTVGFNFYLGVKEKKLRLIYQ